MSIQPTYKFNCIIFSLQQTKDYNKNYILQHRPYYKTQNEKSKYFYNTLFKTKKIKSEYKNDK